MEEEIIEAFKGAALHGSSEVDMHYSSAASAEAAHDASRPPKKRRHISVNLPPAPDRAAGPPAAPQHDSAAGRPPADIASGMEADEHASRRGSRRKQRVSQEADPGRGSGGDANTDSQEEQVAQAQQASAPSPGLKVKLKRQKL